MKGTHVGFSLPANRLATWVARRPNTWSSASTTYQRRLTSLPLGKNVGILRPLQWAHNRQNRKVQKVLDGFFFVKENLSFDPLNSQRLARRSMNNPGLGSSLSSDFGFTLPSTLVARVYCRLKYVA